jgi:hypothetical protein
LRRLDSQDCPPLWDRNPRRCLRRVQGQLALQSKSLTSLLIELLERWLAEQEREQAIASS